MGDDQMFQGKHSHQVRSAAFSWALKGGFSLLQLLDAGLVTRYFHLVLSQRLLVSEWE